MQHTCQDCDHSFSSEGQNEPHISPAVQCPNCHSYRTQPSGQPDEQNDMLHTDMGMPTSTQDDMSGNPLQEGSLGGWKDRSVRDESFGGGTYSYKISLFETPEFETTQILAPPDLYADGMGAESSHRSTVYAPKGITDNLHAALGNLGAWVENPYENGQLRPYYNKYWKVIRPEFMNPGNLQVGVADPHMSDIIQHVAETDDLTPLYEYRGQKTSAALLPFALPAVGELAAGIGGAVGDAAGAIGGGASALGDAVSASGVGGVMKNVMGQGIHYADDLIGAGNTNALPQQQAQSPSFYARRSSDENDAFPSSHDEVPKNDDGDSKEKDDGNSHEWQRDISVNGVGGTDHSPSFSAGGPAMERFMDALPVILKYLTTGQDGSQDPILQGVHQALEGELPGYMNHADDGEMHRLIMILSPNGKPEEQGHDEAAEPEKNEPDHTDENSGGAHSSKVASVYGEAAEFLPSFEVELPSLNPSLSKEAVTINHLGLHACPNCGSAVIPEHHSGGIQSTCPKCGMDTTTEMEAERERTQALRNPWGKTADTQGPQTPEQIQAVQQWLIEHGQEMGLEGDELIQTILSVPTNPLEFADVLANIQGSEKPPEAPQEDAGMNSGPPAPAQEQAPPQATMPVPPMGGGAQMMAAIAKYAADSIARKCPECGSHTTELIGEDGKSRCHACNHYFTTKGEFDNVHPGQATASTHWNVEKDFRKEAGIPEVTAAGHDFDLGSGRMMDADTEPVQGVPIADQTHQRDLHEEHDSGHTWTDEDGNPLKTGQEYEMYSSKYDIPDLVRIEAVKPNAIVYTLTGEFGLEHSTELTKEEANIEGTTFKANADSAYGPEDEDSLEHNNDDNSGFTGTGRDDISQPVSLVSSSVNSKLDWLKDGMKTAGADFTPYEQRQLIEESGIARNSDLLDLVGTHYISDADDDQFAFGW